MPLTPDKGIHIMPPVNTTALRNGAIAQLGERLHGMQEVSGSIPLSSTTIQTLAFSGGFFMPLSLFRYHFYHSRCN